MTDTQADLTEPMVREIIAAFEAPQEGHELAQKLERVWPIIKRALLASVSRPTADLTERARAALAPYLYATLTHAVFGSMVEVAAAFAQSEREAAAAEARRADIAVLEQYYAAVLENEDWPGQATDSLGVLDCAINMLSDLASPAPQEETR